MRKLLVAVLVLAFAAPAAAKLGPNPSNKRLASEFLRLLHDKDTKGLEAFLSPAFLLQRPDGTWLTKEQYLAAPAVIESYTVTDVHGTRTGDVRVIRYTVQTMQTIDGQLFSADPVPRLSTYVRHKKTWQIVAHANFNAPAT
ncbi:MAG: nuclear transport factor 2 family protein [Solirubrobacteraceae bacterium]